jgi:hypothetical protein
MTRLVIVVAVMLGGCFAEAADDVLDPVVLPATIDLTALGADGVRPGTALATMCELAGTLPDDDVCSLLCDPDAFAASLIASGMQTGACYHIACALSDDVSVSVGVCMPTSPVR